MLKSGLRILAVASGPIYKRKRARTLLIGVVGREGTVEGVLSANITVDGDDATKSIAGMLKRSRFKEQVKIIASNGIALAGLNVIDINMLEKATGVPTLILTRSRPSPKALFEAVTKYAEASKLPVSSKLKTIKKANERKFVKVSGFYVQSALSAEDLNTLSTTAFQMLRLAHMIAKGISTGESTGRI